jgi:hypothetical protein
MLSVYSEQNETRNLREELFLKASRKSEWYFLEINNAAATNLIDINILYPLHPIVLSPIFAPTSTRHIRDGDGQVDIGGNPGCSGWEAGVKKRIRRMQMVFFKRCWKHSPEDSMKRISSVFRVLLVQS